MTNGDFYITEIEAHNWESHLDTHVHLTNGINAFIGTSNSGKSSLLRLTEWVMTNTPSGDEFINLGEDDCWGALSFSNGYRIKRRKTRSGNVNTYELFKDGKLVNDTIYTGFGIGVPQAILEATGVSEMRFNFAKQLEAPFLLSDSPKSRADTIGNLGELAAVDKALDSTNEDHRANAKNHKQLDAEIKQAEKERDALQKQVDKDAPKIALVQQLLENIQREKRTLEALRKYVDRLHAIQDEMGQVDETIARAERILAVWDEELPQKVEAHRRLVGYVARIREIAQEIDTIHYMSEDSLKELATLAAGTEEKINVYRKMDAAVQRLRDISAEAGRIESSYSEKIVNLDYTPIERQIESYRALLKYVARLKEIRDEVDVRDKQIVLASTNLDTLIDQFVEALQNEKICPTCMQATDGVNHEHVKQTV